MVKEDNTVEWYLYIHLVISDTGFANTLSPFVKHTIHTEERYNFTFAMDLYLYTVIDIETAAIYGE